MQPKRPPQKHPGRLAMTELPNGAWLAAVMAVHGLVLGGIAFGSTKPPEPIKPPAIVGMVIPPAPAAAPPAPRAEDPKPKPKPRRAPKPRPPAPPAPPSERAILAEKSAPAEPDLLPVAHQVVAEAASDPPEVSDAAPSLRPEGADGPPITLPRQEASHLSNPAPRYPSLSRRFGEQGRVLLDVYILPDGTVGEIRLNTSSGFARLDEAALAAVRHWRFVPARRGDEAIPYWYVQPITFSLDR